jgi:hypothetical protein
MKRLLAVFCLSLGLISTNAYAAAIVNGDFATCDLTGWETADDFGDANLDDFSVNGLAPDCAATITIDDANSMAISNSLLSELDLSVAAGNSLDIRFDFSVGSLLSDILTEGGAGFSMFFINENIMGSQFDHTGQLGEIFNQEILGAESFLQTFTIDESFYNTSGWTLEIQLGSSFRFEESSSLTLNSVSLLERSIDVSAPASFSLVFLSFLAISLYSRNSKRLCTKQVKA